MPEITHVITYRHLRWTDTWCIVKVNANCIMGSIRSEPVSLYFPLKFRLGYCISDHYYEIGPGWILRVHAITNIRILNIIALENERDKTIHTPPSDPSRALEVFLEVE